ncbi:MAG: hypothetical protein V1720_07030 [bacterium]
MFTLLTSSSAQDKNKSAMKEILLKELDKHLHLRVDDVYKFIHQASFGSEHAVKDTSGVRKWMDREIAGLDYSINDELIDTLSSDGRIVRINLRPYLKAGYNPEILLTAFIETANNFRGSIETFKSYWAVAEELASEGKYLFDKEGMIKLFDEMSEFGFPAVHHSEEYADEYKPAYRVVDITYMEILTK